MKKYTIKPVHHPDKVLNYWKRDKLVVALIIIFGIGYNASAILGPIYQGKLIDALRRGDRLADITGLAAIFVLLIDAVQLMRYLKRFYTRRFANSTSAVMRLMIYNNIINRSFLDLEKENIGDLMTRALADVDLCVDGMRKFTTEIFDTGVLMAAYFISMLYYDIKITLLGAVFIPVAMAIAEKLKALIYKYSIAYRAQSSAVTSTTYDYIENAVVYRLNGLEQQTCEKYDSALEDLQNKAIKANILENSMQPVYNVIAMLGVIIVIYMGGHKVITGVWTLGNFSAYLIMFTALAAKASAAAKLFNSVQKSQISWQRIKPYLTEYKNKLPIQPFSSNHTTLTIKDLSFHYPGAHENIIENVHMTARQGEIIGVTGSIASGKSTLGLSLLGIYPYLGSIQIDGRELKDYSEYERSQMISYLGHNPQLLSDTIYNNITMGLNTDITAVLQDVCFDADMAVMPDGVDTLVGNSGIRLSGGQQARIALARALMRKNKIIVLDDPFSAVDMITEEKIIDNLRRNYDKCLIILISHRLAAFSHMDRIVLLHGTRPMEYGTHQQLMESSDIYANIYNLQQMAGDDNE
jgi:ABC-type multidrug transport system, ATPase and permease components